VAPSPRDEPAPLATDNGNPTLGFLPKVTQAEKPSATPPSYLEDIKSLFQKSIGIPPESLDSLAELNGAAFENHKKDEEPQFWVRLLTPKVMDGSHPNSSILKFVDESGCTGFAIRIQSTMNTNYRFVLVFKRMEKDDWTYYSSSAAVHPNQSLQNVFKWLTESVSPFCGSDANSQFKLDGDVTNQKGELIQQISPLEITPPEVPKHSPQPLSPGKIALKNASQISPPLSPRSASPRPSIPAPPVKRLFEVSDVPPQTPPETKAVSQIPENVDRKSPPSTPPPKTPPLLSRFQSFKAWLMGGLQSFWSAIKKCFGLAS
jgi:hypothetical protein